MLQGLSDLEFLQFFVIFGFVVFGFGAFLAAVGVGSWLSPLHVAHDLSAKDTKDAVKQARRDMTNNVENFFDYGSKK